MTDTPSPLALRDKARLIVEAALERKAEDVRVLQVQDLTSFADLFVLLTGRADRQVRAIADHIAQTLKNRDDAPMGIEGLDEGSWVLLDCNDVIVHAFDPDARTRYDLDRLWHDAPTLDLGIEGINRDGPEPPEGMKEKLAR